MTTCRRAPVHKRQVRVSVETLQHAAGGEFCGDDDDDEVTVAMVWDEPGM